MGLFVLILVVILLGVGGYYLEASAQRGRRAQSSNPDTGRTLPNHRDAGFRSLILPGVIQFAFLLGTLVSLAGGGYLIWLGTESLLGGEQLMLAGAAVMILGPFICRILAEAAIIVFKIYALLEEMNAKMDSSGSAAPRKQSGPPPLG